MADDNPIAILRDGVAAWNQWRRDRVQDRGQRLDLTGTDLSGLDLAEADLSDVILNYCNLSGANLASSFLIYTEFIYANLCGANLDGAVLQSARLLSSDLTGASLRGADLRAASLVLTNLTNADLTGCYVYGTSTWSATLTDARQSALIITRDDEPAITVDNLDMAQFIYLLLNNSAVRDVVNTITSKVVLVLGRFTPERMPVLDALRDELRRRNYSPIVFDFEKPATRDITETVSTLAHLARFVIADITDAKSIPQELERIVPSLPSVPVQPLLHGSEVPYGIWHVRALHALSLGPARAPVHRPGRPPAQPSSSGHRTRGAEGRPVAVRRTTSIAGQPVDLIDEGSRTGLASPDEAGCGVTARASIPAGGDTGTRSPRTRPERLPRSSPRPSRRGQETTRLATTQSAKLHTKVAIGFPIRIHTNLFAMPVTRTENGNSGVSKSGTGCSIAISRPFFGRNPGPIERLELSLGRTTDRCSRAVRNMQRSPSTAVMSWR